MVEIKRIDTLDEKDLNVFKSTTKKKQISLFDTQRRFRNYVLKLKYRRNGKNTDIPHFVICKSGEVYQIFDTKMSSKSLNDKIDSKQIKIALENLGWLKKNSVTGNYANWIGDPYRATPLIKEWRNHQYWDTYTDEQITSLVELTKMLCDEHQIPFQTVPSHGYFSNVVSFSGIVCKSNFSNIFTHITPAFNFDCFKKIEE
jgi:hypothetical protein